LIYDWHVTSVFEDYYDIDLWPKKKSKSTRTSRSDASTTPWEKARRIRKTVEAEKAFPWDFLWEKIEFFAAILAPMKIGNLTKSIHERKNRTSDATKKQSTSYMYVKHDRKCKMRFGIGIGDSKRDTRVCDSVKR